jgi:thiamine kinase-like enzyme
MISKEIVAREKNTRARTKITHTQQLGKDEEIRALNSILGLLPEIQESISAAEHSAYRMPRYFSKSFRKLLLKEGVFEPKVASNLYKNILEKVKRCFYDFQITSDMTLDDYVKERCIGRYKKRIQESQNLAKFLLNQSLLSKDEQMKDLSLAAFQKQQALEILCKILSGEYSTVDIEYKVVINENLNLYFESNYDDLAMKKIQREIEEQRSGKISYGEFQRFMDNDDKMEKFFKPTDSGDLRLIHGDLHFDNILIDPFDLSSPVDKLIDPGDFFYKGGDVAYDLGKLMHSFNGFYDFIHEGLYDLHCVDSNKVLECTLRIIGNEHIFKEPIGTGGSGAEVEGFSPLYGGEIVNYLYIREHNSAIVENVFSDFDWPNLLKRARYNEAIHFLTMAPFHIRRDPRRTLAIYLTGLVLMKICSNNFKARV